MKGRVGEARSRRVACLAVQALGGLLLLAGVVSYAAAYVFPSKTLERIGRGARLPWGEAPAIVVANGQTAVGIQPYGRIEVYSPRGELSTSWFLDIDGGTFFLRSHDDSLQAYIVRTGEIVEFDLRGRRVQTRRSDMAEDDEWNRPGEPFTTPRGVYRIHNRWTAPKIVRVLPEGRTEVAVRTTKLWFLGAPYPGWFYALLGVSLLHLGKRMRSRGIGPGIDFQDAAR